jgi:hypothetical protein
MRTLLVLVLLAGTAAADSKSAAQATEAKMFVKKLAFEAYPQWATEHPDKACPAKLADLLEFTDHKDIKDPWKHDLKMFCGANLPKGAKGLAIQSAGPDGKLDTKDDIKSWED